MNNDFKEWLKRAKSNLQIAKLSETDDICYEDLCFECQQCAEKALKAVLVYHDLEIPRVLSFHTLIEKLEKYYIVPSEVKNVVNLNNYAVWTRYPGDYEPLGKNEYNEAIVIAKEVLNWVTTILK